MELFLKSKAETPGEFSEIGQTGSTAGNERNRMMNETCQMFCRDEDVVQRRIGNDVVLVPITHQFGDLENIFALARAARAELTNGRTTIGTPRAVVSARMPRA